MEKRYQVFVSSTYEDLQAERSEVMQALLELECMPAGMELFPAANETQWSWIKKVIDESDYYILIVAGRYGSVSKDTGQSYTEMEYRYALEIAKPIISFYHASPSEIKAQFTEQDSKRKKKLEDFRNLVKTRLCKPYSSPSDLGAKVSRSITQLKKQYPAIGWIRANELDNILSSDEILKLKNENEKLKEKLINLGIQIPKETELFASGKEMIDIKFEYDLLIKNNIKNVWIKKDSEFEYIGMSWDDIFIIIAKYIIKEGGMASIDYQRFGLENHIYIKALELLHQKHESNKFKNISLSYSNFEEILLQFRTLKMLSVNSAGKWR